MKSITSLSKRFRISLTLLTALAVLPLGSTFQSAQAKPKSGAPAYGYRAKNKKKAQKRQAKRARRQAKRAERRDRRNDGQYDDYRNGDYRNNDSRNDDYSNDDYRNDRNGDYRDDPYSNGDYPNDSYDYGNANSRTNDVGERVRDYFRIFNNNR